MKMYQTVEIMRSFTITEGRDRVQASDKTKRAAVPGTTRIQRLTWLMDLIFQTKMVLTVYILKFIQNLGVLCLAGLGVGHTV